jgi:hypothetical protein
MKRGMIKFKPVIFDKNNRMGKFIEIIEFKNIATREELLNLKIKEIGIEYTTKNHYFFKDIHDDGKWYIYLKTVSGETKIYYEGDIISRDEFSELITHLKLAGNRFAEIQRKYLDEYKELQNNWLQDNGKYVAERNVII